MMTAPLRAASVDSTSGSREDVVFSGGRKRRGAPPFLLPFVSNVNVEMFFILFFLCSAQNNDKCGKGELKS